MKIIELSNHPKEMLQPAYARAEALFLEQQTAYEQKYKYHQDKINSLRAKIDRSKGFFGWISKPLLTKKLDLLSRTYPSAPVLQPPLFTDDERRWKAGLDTEESVAEIFANALSDDWTLIKGYRNRAGEIDQILLGPQALLAIEIKGNNAAIHVQDDTWYATKFDNYGNQKDQYLIQDKKGRTPGQQLKASVNQLEAYLEKRKQAFSFIPVVFLAHPNATLTLSGTPIVNITNHVDFIWQWINESDMNFDPARLEEIASLIVKDHQRNNKKLSNNGANN